MVTAVICGGRDWRDHRFVFAHLDRLNTTHRFSLIVEGGQRTREKRIDHEGEFWVVVGGVDYFARKWAISRGIRLETEPANWKRDGKAAGPIRNRRMLELYRPDLVIGFPGGAGTANMLKQARAAGVHVIVIGKGDKP